jgi:hypothetical protein
LQEAPLLLQAILQEAYHLPCPEQIWKERIHDATIDWPFLDKLANSPAGGISQRHPQVGTFVLMDSPRLYPLEFVIRHCLDLKVPVWMCWAEHQGSLVNTVSTLNIDKRCCILGCYCPSTHMIQATRKSPHGVGSNLDTDDIWPLLDFTHVQCPLPTLQLSFFESPPSTCTTALLLAPALPPPPPADFPHLPNPPQPWLASHQRAGGSPEEVSAQCLEAFRAQPTMHAEFEKLCCEHLSVCCPGANSKINCWEWCEEDGHWLCTPVT